MVAVMVAEVVAEIVLGLKENQGLRGGYAASRERRCEVFEQGRASR